jgi:hypothetical protein
MSIINKSTTIQEKKLEKEIQIKYFVDKMLKFNCLRDNQTN